MPGAHRCLVHDQSRGDIRNQFPRRHAVLCQRFAGIDNVDDLIRQTHQGRQFHGAIELDEIGVQSLARIVRLATFMNLVATSRGEVRHPRSGQQRAPLT